MTTEHQHGATEDLHDTDLADDQCAAPADESVVTGDPVGLLRDLEASGRFVRDTGLGRIFHPGKGKISYRQAVRENSLHILIDGNRVSAHIDSISPLVFEEDGTAHYSLVRAFRYSFSRVVVHNLASFVDTLWRVASGNWNQHRCEFHCERIDLDETPVEEFLDAREAVSGEGCEPADGHETSHGHTVEAETPTDGDEPARDHSAEVAAPGERHAAEAGKQPRRLPFNVVDQAINLLDTQAAPWSVQLEARVAGSLDESRLRTALDEALRRHPMARARKVAGRRTRAFHHWEIPPAADVDPLDVADCPDDAALAAARAQLQSTGVPLDVSPPLRARLARSPEGDVLMLNLNHAATDGFGGLRLLYSIARAYRGAEDPLPPHDPLDDRTLPLRLAKAERFSRLRRFLALTERLRDLVSPPARLAPRRAGGAHDTGYGFHHVRLGEDETQALVDADRPGSVNDVLVAALHLSIAAWNARHGVSCGRVAVLVPANLRPPRWREEVVGNFSLPARIATGPAERITPAAALQAVTSQTSRKKRTGMGTALLQLLDASQWLPLWAKQAGLAAIDLTGGRFVDTAILSNLGRVGAPSFDEEAGETEDLWFSAPGRMPLGLSLGVLTVSGRLHLVFRYDHRLFGAAAGEEFAEEYLAQLRGLVSAFTPSRQPEARP